MAERALLDWVVPYIREDDGTLVVTGDLNIREQALTELPDLTAVKVRGSFWCSNNALTTLKNAPRDVGGSYYCHGNQLTSLEYVPQVIKGHFMCHGNPLASLKFAPKSVDGNFFCYQNQLTSLRGGPRKVGGDYWCGGNNLKSLQYAPHAIGGEFSCQRNRLTSLEHAPKEFKKLETDFGTFAAWNDVPEVLRLSTETRTFLTKRKERQLEHDARGATILERQVRVRGPLRLKKGGMT
ncbi:MAG: hypothetical protein ACAH83_01315 [Alphaproteobacteria bacterium]